MEINSCLLEPKIPRRLEVKTSSGKGFTHNFPTMSPDDVLEFRSKNLWKSKILVPTQPWLPVFSECQPLLLFGTEDDDWFQLFFKDMSICVNLVLKHHSLSSTFYEFISMCFIFSWVLPLMFCVDFSKIGDHVLNIDFFIISLAEHVDFFICPCVFNVNPEDVGCPSLFQINQSCGSYCFFPN